MLANELLATLAKQHAALAELLASVEDDEDPVYRFYHQSFKVYGLQHRTIRIKEALAALLLKRALEPWFLEIVTQGTGLTWTQEHNARWTEITRPIVEAYWHSRYFLQMAVRYGGRFSTVPAPMPSGLAALLSIYQLR